MNPFPQREPWVPNQDVFVSELGELIIEIELSCLRRDDISLELNGNCLVGSGKRSANTDSPPDRYLVRQIARGNFWFTVEIPANFAASASKAAYSNGMLRICVPPTDSFKDRLRPTEPPLGGA